MSKKIDFSEVAFKNVSFEITHGMYKQYNPSAYAAIGFFRGVVRLGDEKTIQGWIEYFDDNQTLLQLFIGGSIIPVHEYSVPMKLSMTEKLRFISYLIKNMKLNKKNKECLAIRLIN